MQITQRCARCDQDLTQEHWHPGKWGTNGTYCRHCCREYRREWRYRHSPPKPRQKREPKPPRVLSSSYCAVHMRVRKARGSASTYACSHCLNRAEEWAYDHTDPNPVRGTTARGRMAEYSMDVARYLPLCKRCHARFDAGRDGRKVLSASPAPLPWDE